MGYVGRSVPQSDSFLKVTGTATYAFDVELPGMLHAKLLTSPQAHARIVRLDTSQAEKMPGVIVVATGKDFPYRIGTYLRDRDVLATDKAMWVGHPVVAVVAETLEAAEQAVERVEVDYDPLTSLLDPMEAVKACAPILHERLSEYNISRLMKPIPGTNIANRFRVVKGDVDVALRESDILVKEKFDMPHVSHGFMETQCVVAHYKKDGSIEIWSSAQSPFSIRYHLASSLGVPIGNVVVKTPFCGGGFGGKVTIGWEPLVVLLSKRTGFRPVKLTLSRKEQFCSAFARSGFHATVEAGFKRSGKIIAYKVHFVFDAGASANNAVNMSRAAGYAPEGCYDVPNVFCESLAVYTTKVPTGTMRGFGFPESHWVLERTMDIAAALLKIDPARLRFDNLKKPGLSVTATGERLRSDVGDPFKVLKTVVQAIRLTEESDKPNQPEKFRGKGIALCIKGPVEPPNSSASAVVKFNEDASVDLIVGTGSMGQGTTTSLSQIVADEFGIPIEKVHVGNVRSTDMSAYTWATASSRGLFADGIAVMEAIRDAKAQIKELASQVLKVRPEDLDIANERVFLKSGPWHGLPLTEVIFGHTYPDGTSIGGPVIGRGNFISTQVNYLDLETGQGIPSFFHTFGGTGVEIEVDVLTGQIEILRAVHAFDVGKAINPLLVRGQIDGGFFMGQSIALCEELIFDEQGWVVNPNLSNYRILRAKEIPREIDEIIIETPQSDGPHGARGLGEVVMVAVAPAIANALYNAVGVQILKLPMSPENVWRAIQEQRPNLIENAKHALMVNGGE